MGEVKGGIWDPESYDTGSFLDGKRGVIREAEFVRHNCKGHCQETGALRLRLVIPDVAEEKQPFPADYNVGKGFWPSTDGETKAPSGPRIISTDGRRVHKATKFFVFRQSLAQAGFPMEKFAEQGAEALNGADVTIRAIERQFTIKGEKVDSTVDAVGEFHGFVGEAESGGSGADPVDQEALVAELGVALAVALEAQGGAIPRGQLSIRLNKVLEGNDHRVKLLQMVTDDDVLGQIEGITFDKKQVALA